jgi:hypothetical protein
LLKQEIQNGVLTFLNNLPENVKGMNTEWTLKFTIVNS